MKRRVRPVELAALLSVLAIVATACGGAASKPAASHEASATVGPRDRYGTVWLCRPRLVANPCTGSLIATAIGAKPGTPPHVVHTTIPRRDPGIDCFYVYPTVSPETTVNADLAISPILREVAISQAAPFSPTCRVYAPVYRQITVTALGHPKRITRAQALVAYDSVLTAFRNYLAHYNHGRGIVFIGHSQGASILIRLLQREVDANPTLRRRVVSAILLGANVAVRRGGLVGGDFQHLPACTAATETGCVIAYSSFLSKPSANSDYARIGSDAGVPVLAPRALTLDTQIMCVNPTALGAGTGRLEPEIPTLLLSLVPGVWTQNVKTPWVDLPDEYTARCETSGDATWLQVTPIPGHRIVLKAAHNRLIGLHLVDLNAAMGNLVAVVRSESAAYRSHARRP